MNRSLIQLAIHHITQCTLGGNYKCLPSNFQHYNILTLIGKTILDFYALHPKLRNYAHTFCCYLCWILPFGLVYLQVQAQLHPGPELK